MKTLRFKKQKKICFVHSNICFWFFTNNFCFVVDTWSHFLAVVVPKNNGSSCSSVEDIKISCYSTSETLFSCDQIIFVFLTDRHHFYITFFVENLIFIV